MIRKKSGKCLNWRYLRAFMGWFASAGKEVEKAKAN
jgi:hypothetical protein